MSALTPKPAQNHLARSERRIELMEMAVELEVDKNDFAFHSHAEEAIWDELQSEFDQRADRLGRTWVADAA